MKVITLSSHKSTVHSADLQSNTSRYHLRKQVRLFLDGAIKIVHTAPWPTIQTEMSLATAGIYRMIRLRLPGVTEDCSIVQMLYRQRSKLNVAKGAVCTCIDPAAANSCLDEKVLEIKHM